MLALHVFQANLRKPCLIFHQRQQNTGPSDPLWLGGRTPSVNKQHPGPGVSLAVVSAAMDQTVITSCSKGKLLSDWQGIFYRGGKCGGAKKNKKKKTRQNRRGEVSMKKNQRVGGRRKRAAFTGTAVACSSAARLNGRRRGPGPYACT